MNIAVISYLYVVFLAIAWLIDCLPFLGVMKNISLSTHVSLQIIKSNDINDSEKQKMLLDNSFVLFKRSLTLLGFIVGIGACGLMLLFAGELLKFFSYSALLKFIATLPGFLLSVIAFFSYFFIKKLYVKVRL